MQTDDVAQALKTLIEDQNDIKIAGFDQQRDIDSFTMMLMITYVGSEFGVDLDMNELDFDAFLSLNSFAALVVGAAKPAPA